MKDCKKAYLYCDPRSLNDATNYYVGIIMDCLIDKGYSYAVVHKLSDINKPDVILTITERYYLCAKLRFPSVKTIYWAQGVGAEEAKMNASNMKGWLRYLLRRVAESMAVNKSDILFCVSKRMIEYYSDVYGLKNHGKCITMPCYNLPISPNFDLAQYSMPTFCYAGNSSSWQGVDLFLEIYKLVENQIPTAKIIICTGEQEIFEEKIISLGIKNYEIKYVPVNNLQDELHKYKYGFIIRDNHIVNQVATPTKMNSYLANYMIPIYSDTVQDFKDNIHLGEFRLMAQKPLSAERIAKQIVDFEGTAHDFSKYRALVERIFENHYNDSAYKKAIKELMLKKL